MRQSNYDKFPAVKVNGDANAVAAGWNAIGERLSQAIAAEPAARVMSVETYPGVLDDVLPALRDALRPSLVIETKSAFKSPNEIEAMFCDDVTSDPVFGFLTRRSLIDLFDAKQLRDARSAAKRGADEPRNGSLILIYGPGATLIHPGDILVYADMARWELQMRMRRGEIDNLGLSNRGEKWSLQYKRGFFVDWRIADRHKRTLMNRIDFLLDTNDAAKPKMITGDDFRAGLRAAATRPFRVVPFFDPAPWGGQWMKEVCDLDRSVQNYGWCFDCVPEENSLLLAFGDERVEVPSINVVFAHPRELLGEAVYGRFGAEFPIRFDFLDTFAGGNLSFQVHPLTEYIQRHFGMTYTQDESYYLLDAGADACVYLGLKEGVDPADMERDLRRAQAGEEIRPGTAGLQCVIPFDADRYANRWPAKKHDHFLIPAGTVHCSGAESMVLEISATPYIFTFKLWDWGRLGLDGKPRPIHLDHGVANIQWDRTTDWVKDNLVNAVSKVGEGDGYVEERTGLHAAEFIETRRHWFTKIVPHDTAGGVNVLNLVEGDEAIVESPTAAFEPFVVHYAETFIVPASVGAYTVRPANDGQRCGTLKAFVRAGGLNIEA